MLLCRSEPARDGMKNAAFIQKARVFVNDHREQARSYKCVTIGNPFVVCHMKLNDLKNPQ